MPGGGARTGTAVNYDARCPSWVTVAVMKPQAALG